MRPAHRLAAVVLGLAAVVYGAGSLTGGWLGTPPWWEAAVAPLPAPTPLTPKQFSEIVVSSGMGHVQDYDVEIADSSEVPAITTQRRRGREWISGGVVAVGLAVAALGAWSHRRATSPSP